VAATIGGRPWPSLRRPCYAKRMSWSRKFAKPIVLKDGRTIASLSQAREMMLSLPPIHRRAVVWQSAAELLNEAATDRDSVPEAGAQLTLALKAEGLL
jgi:hypothetical protein